MQPHEQGDQVKAATAVPPATKKVCRIPGCGRQLHPTNQGGLCNSHLLASKKPANGHTAGNGAHGHASKPEKTAKAAAHASRAHGHASKSGNNSKPTPQPIPQKIDRDQLVEERINGVMLAWPAKEKMRVVSAWLAGAI